MRSTESLAARTAVVTGASRGIGAAIARALAGAGVRVALLARTRDALENLASEIGSGSLAIPCDVASESSLETAIERIRTEFGGPPDIIVNNAGLFTIKSIEETSAPEFESMLATNLTAPLSLVRAFLPGMKSRRAGHIITIGSVADRHIFTGNAAYSATKFGARAMHEVLRAETRGTGVRATLVSPAAVDTDIWEPIQYLGTTDRPDRSSMLDSTAVADAVIYAVAQPADVNIDELRLSRS